MKRVSIKRIKMKILWLTIGSAQSGPTTEKDFSTIDLFSAGFNGFIKKRRNNWYTKKL